MCTKDLCWDGTARDPNNNCECPICDTTVIRYSCLPGSEFNANTC
jgi:hypothetical protein